MKPSLIFLSFITIMITACTSLKVEKIEFNEEKDLYEYPVNNNNNIALRNDSCNLIDKENIEGFKKNLEKNNNIYPLLKRQEDSRYLKNSDLELTSTYSLISSKIKKGNHRSALSQIDRLKSIYPDIVKYSDCLFLEAYCYEHLSNTDSAKIKYKEFLNYSSSKFSDRFRGYRDFDINDSLFVLERDYSKQFLYDENPSISQTIFKELSPKYYFNSYHPGYNINPESMEEGTISEIFIFFGYGLNYKINFGLQTYHKLNRFIDITPALYYSDGTLGLNLAVPFQVYKTENNNFGFKLSPYLKFASIDSLTVEDIRYDVDEMVLNGGVKASAGYYFNQKFSLGAFYKYSLFNKSNPMGLSKSNIEIWWFNEYDISLYYNIFEEVSIKSGIKNGGFVLSLFLSGLEMGYDITNSQFVISADLF